MTEEQPDRTDPAELAAVARAIIDANVYMTLGTADAAGRPWASPVFYAARDYREFYWMSSPEATQCRNIAERPEISIVVFDSRIPVGSGQAVYMSAVAGQVPDDEIDRVLEVYPGPADRGARISPDQVRPPGRYRLYRATVAQHSVLCPLSAARPCPEHGRVSDHRTIVTL
ncbi:MAG TPA: pyridoxamine 5'-phosphate oxidase family protein [Streptosporangiaceae bacterium]|nr:pyridoxamine 5'-phosphate oxidase family protein [Streptosporangiaceae bacterium]